MRDRTISISRGIAIVLMVIGHAECPGWLMSFIYEFHMPLFFLTAGYFFSRKYLADEATFVKKRICGLYLPFLKWSVIFLALHNLMFEVGILNETYGNSGGGVTHPYSWHQTQQNLWNMVTAMGGYDQFLNGAFWFFRGLFVSSIFYLLLFKATESVVSHICKKDDAEDGRNAWLVPSILCIVTLSLGAWKTCEGLKVINIVQGGYREIMGTFFFACGYLFRLLRARYQPTGWNTLLFAVIVVAFSQLGPASMNWRADFYEYLRLPVPALCGCLLTYNVSHWLAVRGRASFLAYCGDHTMPVFVFHLVAFKLVNVVKILWYGLDWRQMGCHTVIHEHSHDDLFWVFYAVVGVTLPLGVDWLWRRYHQGHR